MKTASARPRTIPLARKALIVQRVLVDKWTIAETAAAFDVSERQVKDWVADFRRSGMTSLRRASGKTRATQIVHRVMWLPVRGITFRAANRLRRLLVRERLQEPLLLRRFNDDRRSQD
jgi:transposase-like protein